MADFEDIPNNIAMGADTVIRRKADDSGFEAVPLNMAGNGYAPLYIAGNYYNAAVTAIAKTTIARAANRIEVYPFVPPKNFSIDRIGIDVTTGVASALARIVIYDSDGTNGVPGTRLYFSAADIDCSTNVMREETMSFDFEAGHLYWIGDHSSSTQTLRGIPVAGLRAIATTQIAGTTQSTLYRVAATFGSGSPNPFGSPTLISGIVPEIKFRVA